MPVGISSFQNSLFNWSEVLYSEISKMKLTWVILLLGVIVPSTWADCWWTGCQPNSWAVTGCAQYDRDEKGRQGCSTDQGQGNKYYCCTRDSGSPPPTPPPPSGGNPGNNFVTYQQFSRAVTSNGYPAPSQEQYTNFNNHARSGKISTLQEAAMALAQLLHESDGLRAKREYACAQTQCPDHYRTPGCDAPGQYYYGRGYIQLSWCGYNYRPASRAIFGDDRLVTDPDMVAREDRLAWQTAFWYWGENVHNAAGVQEGKFGASTKAINGALECSSPGNQQAAARFRLYGNVRSAFGLSGPGDPSGCYEEPPSTTDASTTSTTTPPEPSSSSRTTTPSTTSTTESAGTRQALSWAWLALLPILYHRLLSTRLHQR